MRDRTIAVGGTINLGNFETFRLEVSATMEEGELSQGVWLELDTQLRIIQESTPDKNVADHIQEYRRKISLPVSTPMTAEEKRQPTRPCKLTFNDKPDGGKKQPEKKTRPKKEDQEPTQENLVCEVCRKKISAMEAKISRMFTDKDLCHQHLEPYRQNPDASAQEGSS